MLKTAPSLTDQIYDAILDEICDGRLAPGAHLVQENLAARFGVSRQPIQQAMARLKADGMVEEAGRRGLYVTDIDPQRMRDHYGVRTALDGWAAKTATARVAGSAPAKGLFENRGEEIFARAKRAVATGDTAELVRLDDGFHFLIYEASGNPLLASSAEPHWRFLRRAMGDVLRKAETPEEIWRQHRAIFDAVLAGDAAGAERLAVDHVERAAVLLEEALAEKAEAAL